jgi:Ca2+/Na+ antiporter
VVGSNIFNVFFVLGFVALFFSVDISAKMTFDTWVMTAVTATLIGIAFWKKQFSRPIGVAFILSYIAYVTYLFVG